MGIKSAAAIRYEMEVNAVPMTVSGKIELMRQLFLPQEMIDEEGNFEGYSEPIINLSKDVIVGLLETKEPLPQEGLWE